MSEENITYLEFRDEEGKLVAVANDVEAINDKGIIRIQNSSAGKTVREVSKKEAEDLTDELMQA